MTVLEILLYPNAVLRQPCRELSAADIRSGEIQELVNSMVETMYHFPGTVGLAAPQVGSPVQIFVMDSVSKTTKDRLHIMINPRIVQQSQWKYSREGCLSFPEYLVTVKRARKLTMTWFNEHGEEQTGEFRDFEAIIAQHEADHLEGILFLDRVKNIQTDLVHRRDLTS